MRRRPSKSKFKKDSQVFHPAYGYGYFRFGDGYNSVVFFDEVGLKVVFTKNLEHAAVNIIPIPTRDKALLDDDLRRIHSST